MDSITRRARWPALLGVTWGLVFFSFVPARAYTRPGTTELISVASSGAQGTYEPTPDDPPNAIQSGWPIAMSSNARYVAFASAASGLVTSDVDDGHPDIFVRDRIKSTTELVTVNSQGAPAVACLGPEEAEKPGITANGRFVVFASSCSDLATSPTLGVPADTTNGPDIYLRDRRGGTTTMVSVATDGTQANATSRHPSVSADGRYVTFVSTATNLDSRVSCSGNDINELLCEHELSPLPVSVFSIPRIYVRDLVKGTTRVVSVNSNGDPGNGTSSLPSISPDGRYVAFTSVSDNLVPNGKQPCVVLSDDPQCHEVYIHDLRSGKTELISVGRDGKPATNYAGLNQQGSQIVSAEGRFVVFVASYDNNLIPDDGYNGIYLRDRKTHRTEMVSVDSHGEPFDSGSSFGNISANGRYVSFNVRRPTCNGNQYALAVHDRKTGATEIWPSDPDCSSESDTIVHGVPSANGRFVAFNSTASTLVGHDTNDTADFFLLDRSIDLSANESAGSGHHDSPPPAEDEHLLCLTDDLCIPPMPELVQRDGESDVSKRITNQEANLYGASLVSRPEYGDLFARVEVEGMPKVGMGSPPIFYGLRFAVEEKSYEVRATWLLGGTFGLFDCTTSCMKVADLKGGYGTTGERVVFSVPLTEVGLQDGGELSDVQAFSALGSYLSGSTKVLDTVKLDINSAG